MVQSQYSEDGGFATVLAGFTFREACLYVFSLCGSHWVICGWMDFPTLMAGLATWSASVIREWGCGVLLPGRRWWARCVVELPQNSLPNWNCHHVYPPFHGSSVGWKYDISWFCQFYATVWLCHFVDMLLGGPVIVWVCHCINESFVPLFGSAMA